MALAVLFGAAVALVIVLIALKLPTIPKPATRPSTTPATNPATGPATTRVALVITDLLGLLRDRDPQFPVERALDRPVNLRFAARIELDQIPYLCPRRDLWLIHPGARPTREVIRQAPRESTHVTRDRVLHAHWTIDDGKTSVELICANPLRWVTLREGELPIDLRESARVNPDWSRAFSWEGRVVVPGDRGVIVVERNGREIITTSVELIRSDARGRSEVAMGKSGLIAWSRLEEKHATEPARVAMFRETGQWELQPDSTAPAGLEFVLPYADGSALAISRGATGVQLSLLPLEKLPVEDAVIQKVLQKLTDELPERRAAARIELANLGPTARPAIDRLAKDAPAAARLAVRQVLGVEPRVRLAGLLPSQGPSRVIKHLEGGGILLYFAGGVSQEDGQGKLQTVSPAWLAVFPGGGVSIVDARIAANLRSDLAPEQITLRTSSGDWFVEDPARGLQRWMGNHVETIVPGKSLRVSYPRLVGVDSTGRWILSDADRTSSLVLDPWLPDTTPRLPVWTIDFSAEGGWSTKDDAPAIRSGGAFTLGAGEWLPLDKELFADVADAALKEKDLAKQAYEGGLMSLEIRDTQVAVPLPILATGQGFKPGQTAAFDVGKVAGKQRVLVFNQPGQVSLVEWNHDRTALTHVANFSRGIPRTGIRRVWQDSSGRVIIAFDKNKLAVLFVDGVLPTGVQNMMSAKAVQEAIGEE